MMSRLCHSRRRTLGATPCGRLAMRRRRTRAERGEPLDAQTDFYNTSQGRPLRIEDAIPVEYRGVELNVAPLRLDFLRTTRGTGRFTRRRRSGFFRGLNFSSPCRSRTSTHPTTSARGSCGPRHFGAPCVEHGDVDTGARDCRRRLASRWAVRRRHRRTGPQGNLDSNASVGSLPRQRSSLRRARRRAPTTRATFDANDGRDLSRWLAGSRSTRRLRLHSLLVTAESFAEQPISRMTPVAWSAGTGLRYQLTPRWTMDAGIGRRFSGDDRAWYVTFGSAYALGLR